MKDSLIRLTLDRVEGDIAVCLDGDENIFELPRSLLPEIKEGYSFVAEITPDGISVKDTEEEENSARAAARAERRRRLFKNNR